MTTSPAEPPESTLAAVEAVLIESLTEYVGTEKTRAIAPEVAAAILAATPTAAHVETDGGCVPCRTCGGSQSRGWHLHDRQSDLAARIARLEADLAAALAKLAAVEALADEWMAMWDEGKAHARRVRQP